MLLEMTKKMSWRLGDFWCFVVGCNTGELYVDCCVYCKFWFTYQYGLGIFPVRSSVFLLRILVVYRIK
jgi:hypothetical protein